MPARPRSVFSCTACGAQTPKWVGQCPECEAWNTLVETVQISSAARHQPLGGASRPGVQHLTAVQATVPVRIRSGLGELDRVLGGGLVAGSVILLGGEPGIGKSTLLLQTLAALSQDAATLYATGEESAQQIALRAKRLGLSAPALKLLADNSLQNLLASVADNRPDIVVVDSIQTLFTEQLQSAPGSVAQVRETAGQLVRFAKDSGCVVILVGHVTREGTIAGPRVLEHMVDTVLYFEGDKSSSFRLVRAVKNRFGAVNEVGVFAMTERGLREVNNPSAMFLDRDRETSPGRVTMATQEGSRPLLVEVQALVDHSPLANPRRLTVGLEQSRLAMLLAVLHRHAGCVLNDQDVFVNVVGGVRVLEPAADLAIALAVVSSLRDRPLPGGLVVFGEIGLAGEVRPVQRGLDRLREAAKLGFVRALIPAANHSPKHCPDAMEVTPVKRITEALSELA